MFRSLLISVLLTMILCACAVDSSKTGMGNVIPDAAAKGQSLSTTADQQSATSAGETRTTASTDRKPNVTCPMSNGSLTACCSDCTKPTPTPKPVPAGTLAPSSSEKDANRRYPDALSGNALLEVTQGSSVTIPFFCANGPYQCPSSATSTWSGTVTSGLSIAFAPKTTTGGNPTIVTFSTSTSTPVGPYSASVCLTSPQNYVQGAVCTTPFIINVVSNMSSTPTPPPGTASTQSIKVQISQAGSSGYDVPGAGHLYIELYNNGVAYTSLQAGRDPNSGELFALKFSQSPYTQPAYDITSSVSVTSLLQAYGGYLQFQRHTNVPAYAPLSLNSNTWADGLLLAAGVSPTTIQNAVLNLSYVSGLTPAAWNNGSTITRCFVNATKPVQARPNIAPTDCTNDGI